MLGELAERWAEPRENESDREHAVRVFLAERLIFLAACATFVVAPACFISSGILLPGTYGAAAAIALVFITVPFMALGLLSASAAPWRIAFLAGAVWAVLTGTMVSVSPLIALTSGAALFLTAAWRGKRPGLGGSDNGVTGERTELPADPKLPARGICLSLARDGTIRNAVNAGADTFRAGRSFIDHVHLADRIAVMTAMSDAHRGGGDVTITARVDLARRGHVQSYENCSIAVEGSETGLLVTVTGTGEAADPAGDSNPPGVAQQQFLATVSHELRTPLNSIIGFSDVLRGDIFGALANERQREYVNLIHSSGNHLLSIVNTILDVSKLNAGTYTIHREGFDLNDTVGECVAMLGPQARQKSIRVTSDFDDRIADADGDRRAIRQVVINVLSNAIKFTRDGGDVIVSTRRKPMGWEISVCDNGIGMSQQELRLIGKPFIQADNDYTRTCEGTGLGLTVVSGLVALHGGTVDIRSREGEGTQIAVFIPDAPSDLKPAPDTMAHETAQPDKRPASGAAGQKRKDDDNAVRIAV